MKSNRKVLDITCIIPSTCSAEILPYLQKCINSLIHTAEEEVRIKILVVSSNPQGREKLLSQKIDNFYLVDKSLGFAEMNNVAIEESLGFYNADYYLLVNDDVWVEKDFFSVLYEFFQKNKADIVCPLICRQDGSIDSYGIEYFTSGFSQNANHEQIETTLAAAACVIIKSKLLKKIRDKYGFYFNPLLHSYYEDTDFSLRARAVGAYIVKNVNLKVHHIGSFSYGENSPQVMYYTFRNLLWVIFLTWPGYYILKNLWRIFLVQLWFVYCSIRDGCWWIYPKIFADTLYHGVLLNQYRSRTIPVYNESFNFSDVFSPFWFRTRLQGIAFN